MASSNITEAYYSSVSVIVDTISQGVIDISEDVQSCSVNRQVNGASSATITLTNYSSYKNGRYNGLLHIGDRVHVAFIKDSFSIDQLTGKSVAFKNELLFQHGINFNDLPAWQRRGAGVYYTSRTKEGFNPLTNERVTAERRVLFTDLELPIGDKYREFVLDLIKNADK